MLTKRMSATSTSDDGSFPSAYFYNEPSTASGLSQRTAASSKPSAIPRPSTSTRPVDLQTEVPLKPPVSKRPRTYSQPFLYDTTANGVQPTMPASSSPRAESPSTSRIQDVRPTRIPVPRGRSPSFSSSTIIQPNGAAHKNGLTANGPTTDSLITNGITTNGPIANGHHLALVSTALYGHEPSPPSPDTPPVLQHQHSAILRERAPFGTVTAPTATSHGHYAPPPRASRDSDEGQFEHWYRGDTSRNGGVGELRVGRRTEMLEIASYGHTFAVPPASRAGSRLDAPARDTLPGRRRAGSVGARRSFYMEDDADARAHGRVLDEAPLTDVDMSGDDVGRGASSDSGGEDDPADTTYTYSYTNHAPQPAADLSAASLSPTAYSPNTSYNGRGTPSPSPHPTAKKNAPVQESRQKPAVAAQPKMSPPLTRGITEPIPARANATSPQQPRSVASRQPQTLSPGSRGHAKSPAGKGGPTSTKKASKTVTPSRRRVEARRSIGEYPAPADGEGEGDDSLADAIPTWSEPRARGDWDEVVLPAVARKKGLDKEYDAADGSPKPKRVGETVYEPVRTAPHTIFLPCFFSHLCYRCDRAGCTLSFEWYRSCYCYHVVSAGRRKLTSWMTTFPGARHLRLRSLAVQAPARVRPWRNPDERVRAVGASPAACCGRSTRG